MAFPISVDICPFSVWITNTIEYHTLDNDFIGNPETDTVIFYGAVMEFLFNHPNESRISPENKSWVADELLLFVEANVDDDAFEEIADIYYKYWKIKKLFKNYWFFDFSVL